MYSILFTALGLAFTHVLGNPVVNLELKFEARNLSPSACSKVKAVVTVLQANQATPFCSSFLSIMTKTTTTIITTTVTSTFTVGAPTTTILFVPGDPPSNDEAKRDSENVLHDSEKAWETSLHKVEVHGYTHKNRRAGTLTLPSYLTAFATSAVSSGCSCLNLPRPTTSVTDASTIVTTATVLYRVILVPSQANLKIKVPAPVSTKTIYPCANGSALYGFAGPVPGITSGGNNLYGSGTTGTSLTGCCNLCFFEIPGCIQAYYYFYEGCVVNQATISGAYPGVSNVCPNGNIPGLTYSPDMNPPFRSTGDIAGPCGAT